MTDLDLLKDFRSELDGDLDDERLEAAWATLGQRIGTAPAPARGRRIPRPRRPPVCSRTADTR